MISALALAVIPALVLPWALLPLHAPVLFALLPVAPLAWVYRRAVAEGNAKRAVLLAMAWAVGLTVSTIAATAVSPDAGIRGAWHAGAFRDEMVRWIATGAGSEGNIRLFLPRVLVEYVLVLALSAVSAGAAALFLGGLLLGYMNVYVGWVVANADPAAIPAATALLAWPPWSVSRVISFILAGTAGALWGYPRLYARGSARAPIARLLGASVAFLCLDIFLKWWLAPIWRDWLRALLGASAGLDAGGSV